MDDSDILRSIGELVDEEHRLEGSGVGLSPEEADRLKQVEVALDQCWDLLRQRRARRDAGGDPDDATVRSDSVVEGYQQ
jgi:hypothetical protein